MKKICIITLGCKVNMSESESLAHSLEKSGFEVTDKMEWADIFVINTCAVTSEAEKKSRMTIAKIKKVNPLSKIFVCGCASERNPKQFEDKNIKVVYGSFGKSRIIKNIMDESQTSFDFLQDPNIFEELDFAKQQKTRSFIKIQDGCNNFCSYCIIPHLRGRERSRSLESIKMEIDSLPPETREVVLIGINLSAWGKEKNQNLCDVIDLCGSYQNLRFRLGSLETNIINKKFLQSISDAKNFCEHFHLSLQSGCDETLLNMNRKYKISQFKKNIKLVRKFFPNAGITTDVIVGYPTESNENFEETLGNVGDMKFSDIHIFTYSRREGTLSARLPVLDGKIVKERAEKLEELRIKMKKDFLKKQIGKIFDVLVESKTKKYFDGLSSNYIRCFFDSPQNFSKKIVRVRAIEIANEGLFCEIIDCLD